MPTDREHRQALGHASRGPEMARSTALASSTVSVIGKWFGLNASAVTGSEAPGWRALAGTYTDPGTDDQPKNHTHERQQSAATEGGRRNRSIGIGAAHRIRHTHLRIVQVRP